LPPLKRAVSENKHYQGCLFGDSISSALGKHLGAAAIQNDQFTNNLTEVIRQVRWLGAKQIFIVLLALPHCQNLNLELLLFKRLSMLGCLQSR
jgi:hypothetical protein